MCNTTIFLYILINTCLLETRHKTYILLCSNHTKKKTSKEYANSICKIKKHIYLDNYKNKFKLEILNLKKINRYNIPFISLPTMENIILYLKKVL